MVLPASLLPNYKKHEAVVLQGSEQATDVQLYTFEYAFQIKSNSQKITFVSAPEGSLTTKSDDFNICVKSAAPSDKVPRRELRFFYKVAFMLYPQLNFCKKDNEVAVMVKLVPTFELSEPQEAILTSEVPNEQHLSSGKDFHFVFLVDRSGSMRGSRIDLAKEALDLFVQSLPAGSLFSIISFGSRFTTFECAGQNVIDYNDINRDQAQAHIKQMSADHGGTNIIDPLKIACNMACGKRAKRVFVLTDGQVNDSSKIFDFVKI